MTQKELDGVFREAGELESRSKKDYSRGFEDCRKKCLAAIKKLNWQEDTYATHTIKEWFAEAINKVKEKK